MINQIDRRKNHALRRKEGFHRAVMSMALRPRWRVEIPIKTVHSLLLINDELVLRIGGEIRAFEAETGAARWAVAVNPLGSAGVFLHSADNALITDRPAEPERTTEVVVVRNQKIHGIYPLDCTVGTNATAVLDGALYAIGSDHATGMVFRGVELETGKRVVDVSLADIGGAELTLFDRKFLVCNRMASPGLYWLDRTGARADILELLPAHFMQASRGRLMAALRETELPKRTIRLWELATGRTVWSAPGFSPHLAIDGDDAVHLDTETEVIMRDAVTGLARWRATVPPDPLALRIAGPCVWTKSPEGITLLDRATGAVLGEIVDSRSAWGYDSYLYVIGFGFIASFEVK